jgi:hypothetical protein
MWVIKYKNNEPLPMEIDLPPSLEEDRFLSLKADEPFFVRIDEILSLKIGEPLPVEENIVDLEYPTYTEADRDYWLDIITRTYGKWGEVNVKERPDDRPESEIDILNKRIKELEAILSTSSSDNAKVLWAVLDKTKSLTDEITSLKGGE